MAYLNPENVISQSLFKTFTTVQAVRWVFLPSHLPFAPYGVRTSPHAHGIPLHTAHCLGQTFSSHNLFSLRQWAARFSNENRLLSFSSDMFLSDEGPTLEMLDFTRTQRRATKYILNLSFTVVQIKYSSRLLSLAISTPNLLLARILGHGTLLQSYSWFNELIISSA